MTIHRTPKLYAYEVNFIFAFTLVISVTHSEYAREDAYRALSAKFGRSAIIKSEKPKILKALPESARPINRVTDWAWIVEEYKS